MVELLLNENECLRRVGAWMENHKCISAFWSMSKPKQQSLEVEDPKKIFWASLLAIEVFKKSIEQSLEVEDPKKIFWASLLAIEVFKKSIE
ncbi:hypothetical protein QE152_g26384 [Popillia japonica]|uniref:Uncharacterized protein n=1 Tax=Popillia japonica TaxID=7064 RepID=A0AAW1JYW3_POPJA